MFFNKNKFIVCPKCGYGNIKLVSSCGNCQFIKKNKRLRSENSEQDAPNSLKEAKISYDNLLKNNPPPESLIRGLNLLPDEYVLLFISCSFLHVSTIRKNDNRFEKDQDGYKCTINRLALSNKRIFFISKSLMGGWRKIENYEYSQIKTHFTEKQKFYSPILDEIGKMVIQTTDNNEFTLTGLYPSKQFKALANCIESRGQN